MVDWEYGKGTDGKPSLNQQKQLARIAIDSGMVVLSMNRGTAEALIAAIHYVLGDGGDQEASYKTLTTIVAQLELYILALEKH